MQESPQSPFHTEISSYLLNEIEKEGLSQATDLADHSFEDLLEGYHNILSKRKTLPIEQKILEAFPQNEFPLKMLRGLPRIYKRENPSTNHIKPPFSHLPSLKRLGAEKFVLPLYDETSIPKDTKICVFTHVLADGFGDLIAHKETVSILKNRFPDASIQSIVSLPKRFSVKDSDLDPTAIIVPYKDKSTLPKKVLKELLASDLILATPTHHPQIEEIKKQSPSTLCIGQYGFIESDTFHPKSGNYSMGLHFLEKGILIRDSQKKADFRALKNETLLYTLFGTLAPQTIDIETYLVSHKLHLAYLVSPIGGAIYLHALLKAAARDDRTIDICTPDIGWLIEYTKRQGREKKPFLTEDFGIQELEIHFAGKIHRKKIQDKGKKVRILSCGALSDEDFSTLMRLSEEFVAVRGDQSFSEAVSANRMFFYDGAPHARYFVKDLLALAENRLRANKEALTLFRCMERAFSYNSTESQDEWVEETHFQAKEPWEETANLLSKALLKRDTLVGCKQLNQIIRSEYSFNQTLCQIVSREISHRLNPKLASDEKTEIDAFIRGDKPLKQTLEKIKELHQNR